MKTTILTFFVTIIIVPLCTFGQQGIFEYVDKHTADLQTEQVALLETLQAQPQVVNSYLVKISNIDEIYNREQLYLNMPDETVLTVDRTSRVTLEREQVRWNGSVSNDDSGVRFLISQGGMTGMIRSKVHNYDIHPLRDSGLHVLVEIDPSGFEREEPPLMIDGSDDTDRQDKNGFDSGENTILSNPEIRVMVVYTTNAKNNHPGDIEQLISFAVGNMEDAFTSSGVNADVNLVHTAERRRS